uniref:Uncharacterized protein n=1 Tax=Parascaris univalens TaxID=6257 RepID=A0A915BJH4_PARUN
MNRSSVDISGQKFTIHPLCWVNGVSISICRQWLTPVINWCPGSVRWNKASIGSNDCAILVCWKRFSIRTYYWMNWFAAAISWEDDGIESLHRIYNVPICIRWKRFAAIIYWDTCCISGQRFPVRIDNDAVVICRKELSIRTDDGIDWSATFICRAKFHVESCHRINRVSSVIHG